MIAYNTKWLIDFLQTTTCRPDFLNVRLQNARSYDRIAGYFSSSIVEVAGEALESIAGKVRIICNSDLDIIGCRDGESCGLGHGARMACKY